MLQKYPFFDFPAKLNPLDCMSYPIDDALLQCLRWNFLKFTLFLYEKGHYIRLLDDSRPPDFLGSAESRIYVSGVSLHCCHVSSGGFFSLYFPERISRSGGVKDILYVVAGILVVEISLILSAHFAILEMRNDFNAGVDFFELPDILVNPVFILVVIAAFAS